MKKTILTTLLTAVALLTYAVPARRVQQEIQLADGTKTQVTLAGDEFAHYWIDRDGNYYTADANGNTYNRVAPAKVQTTLAKAAARREQTNTRRKANGVNTPPRGLLLLVNFKDESFQTSNSLTEMNKMLNGDTYTYHKSIGSARKYFQDQSNGQYNPQFDVVGPIPLPQNRSYYGSNDSEGNDLYPGTMVWQACSIADRDFAVDFTKYDNDNDGNVDFVFVIYAGYGEADGAPATTIWPHAWELSSAMQYESFTVSPLDGKTVEKYACTSELNYYSSVRYPVDGYSSTNPLRAGIGTFCHEFSHVMGLPDYYDTNYSYNYDNNLTPGNWSLMDGGSYNCDGEIPPSYSAHDKYYVGWTTPTIMNTAENVTLPCDGTTYRYVTSNGNTATATTATTVYYFENRQQTGWDTGLPGHGMLVTRVNYNASKWNANTPNNTKNNLCYQIVAADGTYTYASGMQGDSGDPFPGTSAVTDYSPFSAYPLTEIAETSGTITFKFMGGLKKYTVTFDAGTNGTCATTSLTEADINSGITLPAVTPNDDYTFLGWATTPNAETADAGNANDTYHPTKDLTLYAAYYHEGYVKLNYHLTGVSKTSGAESGEIEKNTAIEATFSATQGYQTLDAQNCTVTVIVDGNPIDDCYTFEEGVLTITIAAGDVTGNVSITVVATRESGGGGSGANCTYTKVTSTPDDWSGQYLIVCENNSLIFDGSLTTLDQTGSYQSVNISGNTITTDSKYSFTITKNGSDYSIKSASGKYIGFASSNKNGLTQSDNEMANSISMTGADVNIIASHGNYLRFNNAAAEMRFRYFKSTTYTGQQVIQLYKYTSGGEEQGSGIEQVERNSDIKVVTDNSSLRLLNLPEECQIKIINMNGQLLTAQHASNTFATSLSKGIYVIQVVKNDGINTIKVAVK